MLGGGDLGSTVDSTCLLRANLRDRVILLILIEYPKSSNSIVFFLLIASDCTLMIKVGSFLLVCARFVCFGCDFFGLEYDLLQIPEWVFYFVKDLSTLMEHHYQFDKLGLIFVSHSIV